MYLTFYCFKATHAHTPFYHHTLIFFSHAIQYTFLLFFFFSLQQFHRNTHIHAHTLPRLASGVVINHQSECLWFSPAPAEPVVVVGGLEGGEKGWWGETRLHLNGCSRFLCPSRPEQAAAQPQGKTHGRWRTTLTQTHKVMCISTFSWTHTNTKNA